MFGVNRTSHCWWYRILGRHWGYLYHVQPIVCVCGYNHTAEQWNFHGIAGNKYSQSDSILWMQIPWIQQIKFRDHDDRPTYYQMHIRWHAIQLSLVVDQACTYMQGSKWESTRGYAVSHFWKNKLAYPPLLNIIYAFFTLSVSPLINCERLMWPDHTPTTCGPLRVLHRGIKAASGARNLVNS